MEKEKVIKDIYRRLSSLEDLREELRLKDLDTESVDLEMDELRNKLHHIMNSACPIINGVSYGK